MRQGRVLRLLAGQSAGLQQGSTSPRSSFWQSPAYSRCSQPAVCGLRTTIHFAPYFARTKKLRQRRAARAPCVRDWSRRCGGCRPPTGPTRRSGTTCRSCRAAAACCRWRGRPGGRRGGEAAGAREGAHVSRGGAWMWSAGLPGAQAVSPINPRCVQRPSPPHLAHGPQQDVQRQRLRNALGRGPDALGGDGLRPAAAPRQLVGEVAAPGARREGRSGAGEGRASAGVMRREAGARWGEANSSTRASTRGGSCRRAGQQ